MVHAARWNTVLEDVYILETAAQLRALKGNLPLQIVAAFEDMGTCAASDIADALARPQEGLQYHFKKLVTAGILLKQGKRKTGPRMEETYCLRARAIGIDKASTDPAYLEVMKDVFSSIYRFADRAMIRTFDARSEGAEPVAVPTFIQTSFRLSDAAAAEAEQRIMDLQKFLIANAQPEEERAYLFTFTCFEEI
ncbi:MAG: helix-turn-helix transcriptional regulator [Kordiimonadaceae bacterium]|nr:helix-turn-helix transcriptional regulator [Kordiimonadaceae bacterium]